MRRVRGLRAKLFLVLVGGMVAVALLFALQMAMSLFRVRDEALTNAAAGLEDQSRVQLPLLHEQMTWRIQDRLAAIADTNLTLARAFLAADSSGLVNPEYTAATALTTLPDGALADLRPGRITSVYVAPGAAPAEVQTDLEASAILDTLLPQQLLVKDQGILAAAYAGPSGLVRMYPAADVRNEDFALELAILEEYRAGAAESVWLAPFAPPAYLATVDPLVTAAVLPIYDAQAYRGVLIAYVSLGSLTADLIGIQPTRDSWVFVVGAERQVIASAERFLPYLSADGSRPSGQTLTISRTVSPELDAVIDAMVDGQSGTTEVALQEREHLITYRPIDETNWSLALAVPIDELTAAALDVDAVIRDTSQATLVSALLAALILLVIAVLVGLYVTRRLTQPLGELGSAARAIAHGDYSHSVPVRSNDELGDVAEAFNAMITSVHAAQEGLRGANRVLEDKVHERTQELETMVAQLEATLRRQNELDRQLQTVTTPVIPVAEGVLMMPLIGALDPERANAAIHELLTRVEQTNAREVILDITGISGIDDDGARALIRTAAALRLLGAETIVTGIRPEVAELIIALGTDLGYVHPMSSLQSAVALAFRRASARRRR